MFSWSRACSENGSVGVTQRTNWPRKLPGCSHAVRSRCGNALYDCRIEVPCPTLVAQIVRGIAAHRAAPMAPNAAFDLGSRTGIFPFHRSHRENLLPGIPDRRAFWKKVSNVE
jgi:hypothetical protein